MWFNEFVRLISCSVWAYGGMAKAFVVAMLAIIAFVILLNRVGHFLKIPLPDKGAVTVVIVSYVAFVASLAAFNIYIIPAMEGPYWSMNASLLLTALVLLLVTFPLLCKFQKASYPAVAVSALFSAAGAVLAVVLLGTMLNTFWSGSQHHTIGFKASELSDFFLAD